MKWTVLPQVSPRMRIFNLFLTAVFLYLVVVGVYKWQTSTSELSGGRDVGFIILCVGLLLMSASNLPERTVVRYILFAGSVCCVTAVWILRIA
jgi:hypothetical protein